MSTFVIDTEAANCENPKLAIAKFENGILVNPSSLKSIQSLERQNLTTPKAFKRKYLIAETERLQYVGDNFGRNAAKIQNLCQYFVGVVHKKTKTVKLFNCDWFTLKPSIKAAESTFDVPDTSEGKNESLNLAFGSLKKQRVVERRLKHAVETEDLEKSISKAVADVEADEKLLSLDDTSEADSLADVIPPINWDAKRVEEVYNVNDLISSDLLLHLEDTAAELFQATMEDIDNWKQEKRRFCNFVTHVLLKKRKSKLSEEKCKLLAYLNCLILTLNISNSDLKKKDPFPNSIPHHMKKMLASEFFQSQTHNSSPRSQKVMTSKLRDKLVAQIIIVALLILDFNFQANPLMIDVKCAQRRFQLLVNAVGARLERNSKDYFISLKLPLINIRNSKRFRR